MIIILHDYQVINRHADRQQNDDGNITIIISLWSKWSSWLDHHNHFKRVGSQHIVYYEMEGTATGWQGVEWARVTPHRTKYHACVVGGVGGRMMILQNHDG